MASAAFLGLDTAKKKIVFWFYVGVWVAHGLLIYGAKDTSGQQSFSPTAVVFLTECCKLVVASTMFLTNDYDSQQGLPEGWKKLLVLYMVPALLYSIYNNLTFVCLSLLDPSTYFILMQLRIPVTGLVWQRLFKKTLSRQQWVAIFFITIGCAVKDARNFGGMNGITPATCLLVTGQMSLTVVAGVYTEYLLKGYKGMTTNLQNIFMYVDSMVVNVAIMLVKTATAMASAEMSGFSVAAVLGVISNPIAVAIVLNGACLGISTGYFLATLDSPRKAIASALEIVFTSLISFAAFGTDLGLFSVISVIMVSTGVFYYTQPPPAAVIKTD